MSKLIADLASFAQNWPAWSQEIVAFDQPVAKDESTILTKWDDTMAEIGFMITT